MYSEESNLNPVFPLTSETNPMDATLELLASIPCISFPWALKIP